MNNITMTDGLMGKKKRKKNTKASNFGSQTLVKSKEENILIRPVDGAKFHIVYPQKGQRYLQRIDDHILVVYRNRKLLDPKNLDNNNRLYLAGHRIRDLADRSNVHERVTMNFDTFMALVHKSKQNIFADRSDAYEHLHRALVHAIKYNREIWQCCIADQKVGHRIGNLRLGLDMLAEYFRIK